MPEDEWVTVYYNLWIITEDKSDLDEEAWYKEIIIVYIDSGSTEEFTVWFEAQYKETYSFIEEEWVTEKFEGWKSIDENDDSTELMAWIIIMVE